MTAEEREEVVTRAAEGGLFNNTVTYWYANTFAGSPDESEGFRRLVTAIVFLLGESPPTIEELSRLVYVAIWESRGADRRAPEHKPYVPYPERFVKDIPAALGIVGKR